MAFNLRKLFDQASAQLNPLDHGQTASTVRAKQAAVAPAQTVRSPQNSLTNNPVTRGFSRAYDQANVFDNGRTYKQRTPVDTRSAFNQATHNGATNLVGDSLVKPLVRTSMALNQGIGNAELALAGRPTQNANEYFNRQSGLSGVKKLTGYTGTKRQVAGDVITNASNIVAPGGSKLLEAGATRILPKVVPKIIPKIISTAAVGAPVGAVSNVGSYVSGTEPITKQGLLQTAKQGAEFGAAGGAILPVAGAIGGKGITRAGKVASKATTAVQSASKKAALDAALRHAGIQNVKIDKLTPTDQTGYGDLSRSRVDHYKQEIQAGRRPAAISVVKDRSGTNFVEDGKHRLQAYKELGYKNIPARSTTPEQIRNLRQGGYIGGVPDELSGAVPQPERTPAKNKSTSKNSSSSTPYRPNDQAISLPPTIPSEAGKSRKFTQDQVVNRKQMVNDHPVLTGKDASPPQPVGEILADRNQQSAPQGPEAGALPVTPIKANKNVGPSKFPIRVSQRADAAPLHDSLENLSTHPILHNADVTRMAAERISRNEDEALRLAKQGSSTEANSTALQLLDKYLKEGSMEKADDLLQTISPRFTRQGQHIQILSTFSRLTPAGAVKYAARQVEKAASRSDKGGKLEDATNTATKDIQGVNNNAAKQLELDLQSGKLGGKTKITSAAKPVSGKKKSPEEMLAQRIKASASKKTSKPDPIKDMVNTLFKVAQEKLPPAEKKALRNPMVLIGKAIKEKVKYTDVWQKAQDIVQERYKDNPAALEELDKYFNSSLSRPFAKKQLDQGIQLGLKGVDLGKIVRQHYSVVDETGRDLKTKLIEQAGLSKQEASQLSKDIQNRFTELTQAKKDSIIKQMFGEKPTPEQKSAAQRIIEISNIGALTRDDVRPLVAQKLGIPHLTPEAAKTIADMADRLQQMPVGSEERNFATAQMMQFIAKQVPASATENAVSIWKAGLLSGVKTQGGNFVSNGTFAALKKASDIPTAVADRAISLFSHERKATLTGRGLASGAKKGFGSAKTTLKTGIDLRNANDKYEQHGEINLKNKVLQKVFGMPANYIFRGMSAADQPFYYAALKNSLYDQAKAEGFNKGLRGEDLSAYMETAVKNPTERMAGVAKREADKSVLGYDTPVSIGISGFRRAIDNSPNLSEDAKVAAHTALNVLVPFVRVPSAFISRTVDFTPLGLAKGVGVAILRKIRGGEFDQRALSQAIGGGITGTGVIALGIALAQQGQLSGAYPKNDAKEQQRWKAEGITPNSVKLGGTWVSLNYLGPVGLLFGAGKNLEDAKTEDAAAKAGNALAGLGQGLLGQSFLTGLTGFNDALQDPERSAKSFLNSEAASTVPAFLNDAANATDQYQRQADNPTQAVKNRIPGLREINQPKQDVYGNPLKQPTTGANVFSPLKPSDARSNAVTGEVTRLHNVDPKNSDLQVTPTPIAKSVSLGAKDASGKSINTNLSDKQRYDLQSKVGQSIQSAWGKLIATDEYKGLSDADKAQALSNLRTDTTRAAEAQFASDNSLGQYANDYSGSGTKPSKAVSAILDGNLDVASYARSGDTKNSTVLKNDSRGTALLDKVGSLNSDQLKKWKGSQTFDAKYQDLYDRASQIRFGGLPDLPKNNQVLGLYADLLKKRTNDLTPFGENKAKMQFLKDAYKTELPKDSQEILSASASDILNGLDLGYLTRDQVSQAIQYDDTILTNKLSGSPDISNKVRKALGFGDAPAIGGGTAKSKFSYDLYGFGNPISTNRHLRDLVKSAKLA